MDNNIFLNNLRIEEIKNKEKKNESSFVFNNLPNELAITLGNYYRRIILSYMDGISIFALKISGKNQVLKSEFSVLEGMIETPPYLILNLKKAIISLKESSENNEEEVFKLEIDLKNDSDSEYIVEAKDIKDLSGKLEILNPETYLATISPFSSLKVEIYCKNSWGYKRSDTIILPSEMKEEEGLILIDSNHNPIVNVSYITDFVVTGFEDQNEKLILKIETNDSLSPRDAFLKVLEFSSKINEKLSKDLLSPKSSDVEI